MNIIDRWSAMRRAFIVFLMTLAIAPSGIVPGASAAMLPAPGQPRHSGSLLSLAGPLLSIVPIDLLNALQGVQSVDHGTDNRLTFLLLGSDTRGSGIERTDTIMVMSLDLATQKISALSIPRDTARIPNPEGGTFKGKVNAILKKLVASTGNVDQAFAKFVVTIEQLLGGKSNPIEIDYYAFTTFKGFGSYVDEVEPITIDTSLAIKDPKFWDDPNLSKGVYFPAYQTGYQLWALQPANGVSSSGLCNGLWKTNGTGQQYWCRRALPYVRARKGPKNSDFLRASRQQSFVDASVRRVLQRGSGASLTSLLQLSDQLVSDHALRTDFPYNGVGNAVYIFNQLSGSQLTARVVLKPNKYAAAIPGTTAFELKLSRVHAWADAHLR